MKPEPARTCETCRYWNRKENECGYKSGKKITDTCSYWSKNWMLGGCSKNQVLTHVRS